MTQKATDVSVELGEVEGRKTANVADRVSNRTWSGEGATHAEAATEATRKFLGDRRAREYGRLNLPNVSVTPGALSSEEVARLAAGAGIIVTTGAPPAEDGRARAVARARAILAGPYNHRPDDELLARRLLRAMNLPETAI